MQKSVYLPLLILLGVFITLASCDKNKPYDLITPPTGVHFFGAKNQVYTLNSSTTPAYTITIGTTDVADEDRTVTLNVATTTGAVAGTHYTISTNSVVIPAGQTTATINVQGVFAQYTAGRKDTLIFTLKEPSIVPATFQDTVKLAMRGPCFDGDIATSGFGSMLGTYTRTFENGTYGPYTSTVTSMSGVTATSANAVITNIYDSGISATATFNWSTAGSFTVTIAPQSTGFTSGGLPLSIRSTPSTTSTFTYCVNTLTLYLDLYTSAGLVARWVTTIAR